LLPLHKFRAVTRKHLSAEQRSFLPQPASKPFKVMYIINDLSIGGAEMMLYKLLAETDRERFEPVVLSLIDRGALRERIEGLGIAVHTTSMKSGLPSPMGLWRLVRLMRQLKPDLVLGWMYHSCLGAQLASFFLPRRVPVLWSIHYSISSLASEKKLTAAVIRVCAPLSNLAAHVIYVSRASQSQHKPLGYRPDNSCVIPNGINVAEFVPSGESRSSVRSELGLAEDALLFGLMGRYHPLKDHANFLQAAALISKTHPETHFLLIGRGVDNENPILRNQIQGLGLARQTHLLGERNDMPRLAAALDVFSLSSACESFPNVIGEAMACEVSSVVTDVGDAAWIVGEAGRVVPPRDPRALADAWKEMIDIGPEGRMALGRAARSRVIERFTLESVVARYEALYEAVLAREAPEEFALTTPAPARITNLSATFDDTGVR
jgi:glycosyltransferase involved in cell wall biosynthesis